MPTPNTRVLAVTVGDTRTRANDATGRLLDDLLQQEGISVVRHPIIKDEARLIQEMVQDASDENSADAIVLTGGTGISKRDQTHEALEAIFHKRLDGFGEAFRRLAWDQIGPRAVLFRVTAGVVNGCPIFALPGSSHAVRLAVTQIIVPMLADAIELAQGRTTHVWTRPSAPSIPD
jgi:molybdenum cofactor biosynthesis protein B